MIERGFCRENVLTGVIKPTKFAVMTAEEMASDEIKKEREKFNQEAIREHQMSVQQGLSCCLSCLT